MLDQREDVRILPRPSRTSPGHPKGYNPTAAAQVAAGLLLYLRRQAGIESPSFVESPVQIPNGWDTYTYQFRLENSAALPAGYDRPLVLRIFSSCQGVPRARHEFAVQRHLHGLGYPMPEPLLLEEDCDLFGGPFLIMEKVAGQTLFETMLRHPWEIWSGPGRMAAMHLWLHALPVTGFPAPPEPFLERRLEEIRALIHDHDLAGLTPGLDWLATHRSDPPASPSILHLDFHPLNLIGDRHSLSVLDWTEADVGDVHADVGTTLMVLDCLPAHEATLWDRILVPVGRWLLPRRYLRRYRKQTPLDKGKLAYYQALAALRRLAGYGLWLHASPCETGSKPSSLRYLQPQHLAVLQDYFHRWTGVTVSL